MIHYQATAFCLVLLAVQLLGITSAWFVRQGERLPFQVYWRGLFLVCLPLVAGSTIVALGHGPGCWLSGGAAFSLMVLTVTCDFGHCGRVEAW